MINFVIALLIGFYLFMILNYPDQPISKIVTCIVLGITIYLLLESHYYRHREIEYVEATYES